MPVKLSQTQNLNPNSKRKSQNLILSNDNHQPLFESNSPSIGGIVGFNPLKNEKKFSNYVMNYTGGDFPIASDGNWIKKRKIGISN